MKHWFEWPDLSKVLYFTVLSAVVTVLFTISYFPANESATTSERIHMYLAWENEIPFIPASILIYFSLNLLTLLSLFTLERRELKRYGIAMSGATILAGACFWLFPGESSFQRPESVVSFGSLFQFLHTYDRPHNLFPSLHIGYSALTVLAICYSAGLRGMPTWFKALLYFWFVLLAISVLTTHQHHLFDIGTGLLLAWIVYRLFYRKKELEPA